MRIDCPNCRKPLKASAEMAGKKIRCPQCDLRFILPASLGKSTPEPQTAPPEENRELQPLPQSPTPVETSPQAGATNDGARPGVLIGTEEGHRAVEARVKDHGIVRIALGVALLVLGVASIFVSRFFPWTLLATLVCLAQGAREIYWGVNAAVSYLTPESFPADIRRLNENGEDVIETLLLKRLITGTYMVPAGFLKRLAVSLVPRFRYLTPAQMPLFSTAGNLCAAAIAGVPILLVVFAFVGFHPIGVMAELVLVGAAAAAVAALQRCEPGERKPSELIIERPEDQRYFTTGNPADLIHHLHRDVFLSIREQQRFNRELWPPPKIEGGTEFHAVLGVETEPLMIDELTDVPLAVPVLLERVGAGFVAGGWFFLFVIPSQIPFINSLAAGPAVAIGWWFLALSFRMRNSFRFTSDVFRLELHGSSTARQATTQILGAVAGEQREQLHTSQVYWLLHAARIVTECSMAAHFNDRNVDPALGTRHALMSPRYIVRVVQSPELLQRVDTLVAKLTQYRDVRESRDQEAAARMEERARQQAALEHRFQQERIRLEQQLRLEGEYNLEQLRQQGKLREKLMEKMIEQMDPQELKRLSLADVAVPSPAIDVTPPPELPRDEPETPNGKQLNARLIGLLRCYLDKSQPAEERIAAKDEFDDLVQRHGVPPERVEQLTALVADELSRS